ncbi:hypothetical protein A7P53_16690 [Acinetobacter defluvii]|uniref:hypothetical protein n=1 Tax=Acinetobacter defluvii TaxID=1871111 RepID=UPI00148F70C1|nr:hypothetical protein [Acinetobacter defluvii]NNP71404.1 hypothetical protein [Acinetobacter defluvii]
MIVRIFLPTYLYECLQHNPKLSIKEIMGLADVAYSTAARYKQNFELYKSNLDVYYIDHNFNDAQIENYRLINKQQELLNNFVLSLLKMEGFISTEELRESYYKKHPNYQNQTKRTFNRYLKNTRDFIDQSKIQHQLRIKKSINRIGFCTEVNPSFKSAD